ncbi:MAG: hypothetical protein FD144_3611 [Rhodospirillaceae bacterium]|nr:MAG: hypothetical protein FD144_3611 [Rhodospirillaceae bacterium]
MSQPRYKRTGAQWFPLPLNCNFIAEGRVTPVIHTRLTLGEHL